MWSGSKVFKTGVPSLLHIVLSNGKLSLNFFFFPKEQLITYFYFQNKNGNIKQMQELA